MQIITMWKLIGFCLKGWVIFVWKQVCFLFINHAMYKLSFISNWKPRTLQEIYWGRWKPEVSIIPECTLTNKYWFEERRLWSVKQYPYQNGEWDCWSVKNVWINIAVLWYSRKNMVFLKKIYLISLVISTYINSLDVCRMVLTGVLVKANYPLCGY